MDLNLNTAECIKSVEHFGYTTYTNICNGAHLDLAWGIDSWIPIIFLGVVIVGLILVLVWLVFLNGRR